ncbi:hypothetical protein V1260_12835 [Brachybacterium sp. J144]|uniref:hypothetical protein n=1 Tax=Brachybacterium sp. J144 TaxID=3116487 RepID=UPI002E7958BB|nr:hypothetical protein [Brachybacterium sp. J144]MEE1651668.1 hypothetical protein [Brachybacterium sp. J144]
MALAIQLREELVGREPCDLESVTLAGAQQEVDMRLLRCRDQCSAELGVLEHGVEAFKVAVDRRRRAPLATSESSWRHVFVP